MSTNDPFADILRSIPSDRSRRIVVVQNEEVRAAYKPFADVSGAEIVVIGADAPAPLPLTPEEWAASPEHSGHLGNAMREQIDYAEFKAKVMARLAVGFSRDATALAAEWQRIENERYARRVLRERRRKAQRAAPA